MSAAPEKKSEDPDLSMFANPEDPDNWFAQLDTNKDGSLDRHVS